MTDLFAPTTHLEHFRRIRDHLLRFYADRSADGSRKAELATIRQSIEFVEHLIKLNTINPLDTPVRRDEPAAPQPLCPRGSEEYLGAFIDGLLSETPQ